MSCIKLYWLSVKTVVHLEQLVFTTQPCRILHICRLRYRRKCLLYTKAVSKFLLQGGEPCQMYYRPVISTVIIVCTISPMCNKQVLQSILELFFFALQLKCQSTCKQTLHREVNYHGQMWYRLSNIITCTCGINILVK